jgi:hypothetical protein
VEIVYTGVNAKVDVDSARMFLPTPGSANGMNPGLVKFPREGYGSTADPEFQGDVGAVNGCNVDVDV